MKTLPPALQVHLDTGTTTLCWCWRLTRRDGVVQGFTDHDRDLAFDTTAFEAATGFTASEIDDKVGLAAGNLAVEGAITSDRLAEADLAAGLYDDAAVEIFRVDWADPAQRILMRKGSLGEIRRSATAFTAEVRGLAHYLQQPRGRLYQYTCDADLGDSRCGVALATAAFTGTGAVTSLAGDRLIETVDLSAFPDAWLTRGLLAWTTGANTGRAIEVKRHRVVGATVTLELWQAPAHAITAGDTFTITAGCDKQLTTCRAKFANAVNFRGFPHMPGNDFVTRVARPGT